MNFLKIAWEDISAIFKNRFIRVSIIAIIIVPLLYSLLYLYAFWDPYSKLCDMPVAVVNMDKGGAKDSKDVNYGKDVVDKLKENNKIGWRFVDYNEAKSGVEGKKYYGMFVIPENFTENALTVEKKDLIQPEIEFISNDKKNFLAAQINGKVVVELKAEITSSMHKAVYEALFENLNEMKDKMQLAADGSKKLSDGNSELADKMPEMKDGVGKLADGSAQLKDGLATLNGKIPEMKDGVGKLYTGANEINNGITSLNDGMNTLAQKLNGAKDGSVSLRDGATKLDDGLANLQAGVGELDTKITTKKLDANGKPLGLKLGANALYSGVNDLSDGLRYKLVPGSQQIDNGVNELIASMTKSQVTLNSAVNNYLIKYLADNPKAMTDPNMLAFMQTLNALSAESSKKENLDKIAALKKGADDLAAGMGGLSITVDNKLLTGAKGISDGVDKLAESISNSMSTGVSKLKEGSLQLKGGLTQLSTGLDQASVGSAKLAEGTNKLSGGSLQLKNGLGTLNGSIPALADGANKLYDGSVQLNDGLGTLNGKMPELIDGTTKLKDGSKELSDKLADGSNQLNNKILNDSTTMSEFLSKPVAIHEKAINAVKTYGAGFAPYFISLSLWVGGMLMFFVIPVDIDDKIKARSSSIVLGKFLSYGIIGIIQAVLASAIVLTLGLQPTNILLYFAFNVLMSFAFIAIMQCLVFLAGDAGRLLSIVLLILQLTACAGTFPLEVVPTFFKVLNPFMPFTYTVEALREIISGFDYSIVAKDAGILIAIMTVAIVTSVLLKGHADKVQEVIKAKKEAVA